MKPKIFVTTVTVLTWIVVVGTAVPIKRHSLFSCTGWGASCTSGWRTERPKSRKKFTPSTRISYSPPDRLTRFWLTTEKTWGPMGKRSVWGHTDIPYLMSVLDLMRLQGHRGPGLSHGPRARSFLLDQ